MSDNGPPFDSAAFASFARNWEFEHTTSSPGFPQSNGQVERCIQTVKRLLKKAELAREDPFLALLEYRNTPLDGTDGYSPAEMLSSRLLIKIKGSHCSIFAEAPCSTTPSEKSAAKTSKAEVLP